MSPPPDAPTPFHLPRLPVTEALGRVDAALGAVGAAVLVAPPGAGKTTLVPPTLLDAPWMEGGRVVLLEPRRLAARAAAHRIARLVGEDGVGGLVGYRVRGDTRAGPRTRIEVVTEGVLLRMLQSDPALEGVGLVVFDEFHERSLHADVGLALTLQSRALLRPGLRLLVMSATLDAAPVAELLGDAPVVSSEGRAYPVETRFRARPVEGWIEPPTVAAVLRALEDQAGDVLVFLPGAAEIRRTERRLRSALEGRDARAPVDVHALFGALPPSAQDRAVAPSREGRRKVVLATSIAETSLTIEGVRTVVDAGLMRIPRFDPGTGMTRLETVRVTRDAADQRRGRAGRTAPGVCYRLWTRAEDRGLVPRRTPEVLEADLAPTALELATWGAQPEDLRWLDPPPPAAWSQARELLRELEALDGDGAVTDHGRAMAGVGVHPRLAHLLIRGREEGRGALAADVAALLSERDVLRGGPEGPPDPDLALRLEALRGFRDRRGGGGRGDEARLRAVDREAGLLRRAAGVAGEMGWAPADLGGLGGLLALAYPDRVGQRRGDRRGRWRLRNGRGARMDEHRRLADHDWIVAAEVRGGGTEALVLRAAPVDAAEVERRFEGQILEERLVAWDEAAERVRPLRRRRLGALVLTEAPLADADPHEVAATLGDAVRRRGLQVLPWTADTRQLRERLAFLHRIEPERWAAADEPTLLEEIQDWLVPFLPGFRSLADLSRLDLAGALLGRLGHAERAALDRQAPSHVEVPTGSRIRVDYGAEGGPALAVRLQEVFGWTDTPRVADGRVPLTLELLSPAHRPVQVTRDLASFWRDAYFEVRKDLRGRYPKHVWPEDPLTARPTRRTKKGHRA